MANKLRWGILGAGVVARLFAQGLRALPDAELRSVASRTPARAECFARELGMPRAQKSCEDLLADNEVDIVYVATPNHLHRSQCIAALEAGKPVLCEKPFALNANEAREVVEVARSRRLFCMEAMWMRFLPTVREAKAILDSGFAGEIHAVSASLGHPAVFDQQSRLFRPDMGGGALLDLGVYTLAFVSLVLGRPSNVVSSVVMSSTGVDEQVSAILSFANGAQAIVSASLRSHLPSDAVVTGSRGQVCVHAPLYRPEKVSATAFSDPTAPAPSSPQSLKQRLKSSHLVRTPYMRMQGLFKGLLGRDERPVLKTIEGNGYNYEAAEAMRCIREGKTESALLPLDETVAILETADAIRRAWSGAQASRKT